MARSLFGFDWKKSDAHLLLLSKFSSSKQINDFSKKTEWEDVLGEKPKNATERFIKEGYVRKGDLSSCLAYKFKVSELKDLLKKRNLKLSGTKDEIINRLIQADLSGMQKLVGKMEIYNLTSLGKNLVDNFIMEQKASLQKTEELAIDALRRKKFKDASKIIANYETNQVFPRGIGIDWGNYDTDEDEIILRNIFTKKPKQLENFSDKQLELYRIASGLLHLAGWNIGEVAEWLSNNQSEQLNYEAPFIATMLRYYGINLRDREKFREFEGSMVFKINTCNDYIVCNECRKIASRVYRKVDELPILPHEKCTSENGCRCTAGADFNFQEPE